jgi:uncharacterized protein
MPNLTPNRRPLGTGREISTGAVLMMHIRNLATRWSTRMADIDRNQWDRLALPLATPLMEWQWLHDLEASGSIAPDNGWHPCHLTLWAGDRLMAAAPLYIKSHSAGEFVFDHWWAQLAGDLQVPYYPKLVGMSPVTPAAGYRFLVDSALDPAAVLPVMIAAIDRLCVARKLSGCQFNFVDPEWIARLQSSGFMPWQHQSFMWRNPGYTVFNDYLATFKSNQRRNIQRERRRMKAQGVVIRALTGNDIDPRMAAPMYRYYLRTNAQYGPWAARYLNAEFFERIFLDMRHRLLVMAAFRGGSELPAAMALLLHKDDQLIGRYWGCAEPIKDMHFNLCFYAPIEWAIAHRIRTFDPGAGSPHKIYRGFEATTCTSLHRFYHPHLNSLFFHLIKEVNQAEQAHIQELNRLLPYARRRDQLSGSMDN